MKAKKEFNTHQEAKTFIPEVDLGNFTSVCLKMSTSSLKRKRLE